MSSTNTKETSSSTTTTTLLSCCLVAVSSVAATTLVSYYWRHERRLLNQTITTWKNKRQEERTGRIRAEIKLRTLTKQQLIHYSSTTTTTTTSTAETNNHTNTTMTLHAIGTVVSPFTKRMGTPRQPQLVPSARGYIHLNQVSPEAVLGIQDYSHIWVIFEFHANTNSANTQKTKIRPPRAPHKVGQLATRSPHRPNPLGLSLVCVDHWDASTRKLHVTGLDLVHGTPVYDIKPCVPWDIPPKRINSSTSTSIEEDDDDHFQRIRVPSWVSQKDAIAQVEFTNTAVQQLNDCVRQGCLAPLYTTKNNSDEEASTNAAQQTLREILAQDPRSSHKGIQHNARGSTVSANNNKGDDSSSQQSTSNSKDDYHLIFGQCQVSFCVQTQGVQVTQVLPVDFDPDSYVDGVPLISENK